MFLIRCSILNYVNADIEESQYYISQDLKILPYYLIAFQKRNYTTSKMLVEIYSHCKGRCLALSSTEDSSQKRQTVEYIYTQSQKYKAINYYGSAGKIMLLEIIQAHDFLQLFVLISQSEDLYV